jgi:hypothetical protein
MQKNIKQTIIYYAKLLIVPSIILYFLYNINVFKYINFNDELTRILLFSFSSTLIIPIIKVLNEYLTYILNATLISSITISNMDRQQKIYDIVKFYIDGKYCNNELYTSQIQYQSHNLNYLTSVLYKNSNTANFTLEKGYHLLIEDGTPIVIYINNTKIINSYDSYEKSITFYSIYPFHNLSNRHFIWKQIISNAKSYYNFQKNKHININNVIDRSYIISDYHTKNAILKKIDFTITSEMYKLCNHVKDFMEHKTKTCYKICVHGPPGTGKSKIIYKIALDYNLKIYHINNTMLQTDIMRYFHSIKKGIIVIDEIEMFIKEAASFIHKENVQYPFDIPSLHSLLDEISYKKKLVIYFTTNNINILKNINNGSIIRPERIDLLCKFGYIGNTIVNNIINKQLDINAEIPEYNKKIVKFTPAKIINLIKLYNYDKDLIINKINELIIKSTKNKKNNKNTIKENISLLLEKYNINISQKYISYIVNILYLNNTDNINDCVNILKNDKYNKNIKEYDKCTIFEKIVVQNFLNKLNYYHINDIINDIINVAKSKNIFFSDNFYCDLGDYIINAGVVDLKDFTNHINIEMINNSTLKRCDIRKLKIIFNDIKSNIGGDVN